MLRNLKYMIDLIYIFVTYLTFDYCAQRKADSIRQESISVDTIWISGLTTLLRYISNALINDMNDIQAVLNRTRASSVLDWRTRRANKKGGRQKQRSDSITDSGEVKDQPASYVWGSLSVSESDIVAMEHFALQVASLSIALTVAAMIGAAGAHVLSIAYSRWREKAVNALPSIVYTPPRGSPSRPQAVPKETSQAAAGVERAVAEENSIEDATRVAQAFILAASDRSSSAPFFSYLSACSPAVASELKVSYQTIRWRRTRMP